LVWRFAIEALNFHFTATPPPLCFLAIVVGSLLFQKSLF
jgi:hypothetical protein